MTELIEMTDIVMDAHSLELRPGDHVKLLAADHPMVGRITAIAPAPEDIERAVTTGEPVNARMMVTVRFPDGMEVTLDSDFLRVVTWRWHCNHLERVQVIPEAPAASQGM